MFSASARRPARWFCRPSASAASSDIAWLSPSCSCCSSLSPVFDDMAQALDGVHEHQSQPYTSPDAEASASSASRLHVEKVWLLRWPPMKAPFRFAATALVLALAAVALYPVADRVLARRSARQQLRELERALASKPAPLVADDAPEVPAS